MLCPSLLPLELRFTLCAGGQYRFPSRTSYCPFSTYPPLLKRTTPAISHIPRLDQDASVTPASKRQPGTTTSLQKPPVEGRYPTSQSKHLVPRPDGSTSVDKHRKVE